MRHLTLVGPLFLPLKIHHSTSFEKFTAWNPLPPGFLLILFNALVVLEYLLIVPLTKSDFIKVDWHGFGLLTALKVCLLLNQCIGDMLWDVWAWTVLCISRCLAAHTFTTWNPPLYLLLEFHCLRFLAAIFYACLGSFRLGKAAEEHPLKFMPKVKIYSFDPLVKFLKRGQTNDKETITLSLYIPKWEWCLNSVRRINR